MQPISNPYLAIVDYGLGNLFSVKHACEHVGLCSRITSQREELLAAQAVILPGVGAFGDAMHSLRDLGLVETLREIAAAGTPVIGICLGLQLFMSVSYEFGRHEGLGLIEGPVVRFDEPRDEQRGTLKVPQVGWNRILPPSGAASGCWDDSPLAGLSAGEYMYFVHSFYARPDDPQVVLSTSQYGNVAFCSSLRRGNVVAFQFHPERSGVQGLHIYENLRRMIGRSPTIEECRHV